LGFAQTGHFLIYIWMLLKIFLIIQPSVFIGNGMKNNKGGGF